MSRENKKVQHKINSLNVISRARRVFFGVKSQTNASYNTRHQAAFRGQNIPQNKLLKKGALGLVIYKRILHRLHTNVRQKLQPRQMKKYVPALFMWYKCSENCQVPVGSYSIPPAVVPVPFHPGLSTRR
mmetsp:Transcript_22411/g.52857  ORF Transcript_22411/g.52857 Transcript_22411/m.52857 type:complete len:129 (-) Transcript_22411:598-984(-)